jgi:hypothetical protein
VKSSVLFEDMECDPQQKVRVRTLEGATVETQGGVELCIHNELKIPLGFQLVSKQVELVYDGILGRNFLQHTHARECYDTNTGTFRKDSKEWTESILCSMLVQGIDNKGKLTLPSRAEIIERLPVDKGTEGQEGLINKSEITNGVYLTSSLTKVRNNQVITSVLNTNDTEVVTEKPIVNLEEYEEKPEVRNPEGHLGSAAAIQKINTGDRMKEVLGKLRLDMLRQFFKSFIFNGFCLLSWMQAILFVLFNFYE